MAIIVLQGIPASGKSTWAKNFVKDKKDWVIVNRDSIREGTGMYWCPEREDYITTIEDFSVASAIKHGLNVIIDATNLNPKIISKWSDFAKEWGTEIRFARFDVDLDTAIERDKKRSRTVGEAVIRDFYERYISEN